MNDIHDRWALIDLDGTVADYDQAMRAEMRAIQAPSEPPYDRRYGDNDEPPHVRARRELIQKKPGFWRQLVPIALGLEVVGDLREIGFELHVLTKGPRKCPAAWAEKVEWCDVYMRDAIVTVSADKSTVYGRVLVDDYPPYFERWREVRPRGLVVCVAQPWSEHYASGMAPNVLRYDGSNREELRRRLKQAFERKAGEL